MNLRYLEEEISEYDHKIYQAGLKLESSKVPRESDRLGLQYSHRDSNVPPIKDTITDSLILKMRVLIKEYGWPTLGHLKTRLLTDTCLR